MTRQLLAHWSRSDRARRLFFCQGEAVETVVYLHEILASGKTGFRAKAKLSLEDYRALTAGGKPSFVFEKAPKVFPTLADQPNIALAPGPSPSSGASRRMRERGVASEGRR